MHYGDPANGDFTAGMRKGVLCCLSFLNRLYGYKHLPQTMHVDGYGLDFGYGQLYLTVARVAKHSPIVLSPDFA